MGHTNSTANIALPQFIGTDKPTWLGDVNGAFSAIDSKVGTIDADIAATDAKADTAISDAAAAVTTATNANNTAGAASTTATQANNIANNALTVANNADGHTNQLEMKVGLLADLHTTDKTSIVNAINEIVDGGGSSSASAVSYDNTGSDLTATNVQNAIDEIVDGILAGSVTADGVKTFSQIGDELFALVDVTKISKKSYIVIEYTNGALSYFMIDSIDNTYIGGMNGTPSLCNRWLMKASGSEYKSFTFSTATDSDQSAVAAISGTKISVYY